MTSTVALFSSEFPPYPGGVGTYCYEIANAAQKLGLIPVVFAPQVNDSERIATDFEVNSVMPAFYRHASLPKVTAIVSRELGRRPFDFVVAVDLNHVLPVGLVKTKARKIAIVHGTDVKSRFIQTISRLTPIKPYNAFSWIASNSQFTKNMLLRYHPSVRPDEVIVAPLGVSGFWRESVSEEAVRTLTSPFNLDPSRLLFLSVGRIEKRKGLAQAISALSCLPADLRDRFTFLIVGREVDAEYTSILSHAIAESGLDIRLVGVTTKETLRALYHRADLLLHTAIAQRFSAEGFGLVLLEAGVCGLPVLASRVDAIPEIVHGDVNGFLVEDGDVNGLMAKLEEIIKSAASPKKRLGATAKAYSQKYDWESCARTTFGLAREAEAPEPL